MKKIGIIGAMEEEVEKLKQHMEVSGRLEKASMVFFTGCLDGIEVVVVRSGIGKVNAAVCTQILADEFDVTHVINTGIAGSTDAAIDIGDLVISTDAMHHDMDASGFGYPAGQIPRMEVLAFEADRVLAQCARASNEEVNPDIKTHMGRIVSGDQFIASAEVKERIKKSFDALCTEMEGAAIAQTAYLNKIPFVIVRAISDKADQSATVDYPAFERLAIQHSVKLVRQMMRNFKAEEAEVSDKI